MKPMLTAIAGPLRGSSYPLEQDVLTIGRDLSNTIAIGDASVSRKHSVVTSGSEEFHIADAESLNGTFVNGIPVQDQALHHGDRIEIGNSLFIFLLQPDPERPSTLAPESPDAIRALGSTLRVRPARALYGNNGSIRDKLCSRGEAARIAGDLEILLKASRFLPASASLEELGRRLIDLALEGVPADRGALFLEGEEADAPVAAISRPGTSAALISEPFSRTVLRRVAADGEAILSNDVAEEPSLSGARSLASPGVRSVAAVPLLAGGGTRAVLILDSRTERNSLDELHLELLLGLANIAAAAFQNVRRVEWLELERRLLAETFPGSDMVGEGTAMREVRAFVARVARENVTVLILGESGTGKELAARAIHAGSPRAGRPFLAINCASLSETLLESELFGHERGAFTGAITQKKGRLEIADGGTVFLDEVGELPPAVQARLLRFLQDREFERVGGTRTWRVDVRLIAATNRDLGEAIRAGRFREDLFYRLNVVSLTMPPLRQHREDIPLLATYFAARFARKFNKGTCGVSPAARGRLLEHDWPGNVRELSNAIERAVVLGQGDLIAPEDLPESLLEKPPAGSSASGGATPVSTYTDAVNAAKRDVIRRAIDEAEGRYTEAARRLGIHPNYLHRLIRNLGLKEELRP